MANKYRNKEQQLAICAAWKESRLTQTEFCRQNNIRFYALLVRKLAKILLCLFYSGVKGNFFASKW